MDLFFVRPEYGIQLGLLPPWLPYFVFDISLGVEAIYGRFRYEDFISRGTGVSPAMGFGLEVYFLRLPFVWLSLHLTTSVTYEADIETDRTDPAFVTPRISYGDAYSGLRFHFLW